MTHGLVEMSLATFTYPCPVYMWCSSLFQSSHLWGQNKANLEQSCKNICKECVAQMYLEIDILFRSYLAYTSLRVPHNETM